MKKRELNDLKIKPEQELKNLLGQKKQELKKFKAEMVVGRHKNVRLGKNLRREMAQISTVLREKGVSI